VPARLAQSLPHRPPVSSDTTIDRGESSGHARAARPGRTGQPSVRLGDLLVDEGLVTPSQVAEAVRVQKTLDRYAPLGHILVTQGLITRDQLVSVLERHRRSSRLGALLIKNGDLTPDQLEAALAEQRRTGGGLGATLMRLGYVEEERFRLALCRQLHIRFFPLDSVPLDVTLRHLVNEKFALKHRVVPVARVGQTLVVALDDPTQSVVVDELRRSTGCSIEVITSTTAGISRALTRLYHEDLRPRLENDSVDIIPDAAEAGWDRGEIRVGDSADTIVRKLLRVAVDRRVSDIHLETNEQCLQVRFRIDGMLQHFNLAGLADDLDQQRAEVFSRLKILAGLDIAERRRPQGGSFRARVKSEGRVMPMDFRVSIIPGYYGESAVIRVLDPRRAPESIDVLGLAKPVVTTLRQILRSSTGMLLVTGPTGSGKSTMLFGLLNTLYRPEIKILTAEDPIEYVCERFSQHEVNERVGNTFASYVRAFLRHDPEVIMIGEIRDGATAELALRAAQTGHLVLSTLHTNDAISAVPRLQDLGVDTNVCTASLIGVLAQRLVREICWNCKHEYTPPESLLYEVFDVPPSHFTWYRGLGCVACHHTGYRGRIALVELWRPSDEDVRLINQRAPLDEVRASAERTTLCMADDALTRLREGRTTLDELRRVLPHSTLRQIRATVI
jgi:type IV pilus assembly protein PilB